MSVNLVQMKNAGGERIVAVIGNKGEARRLGGVNSTYELAMRAIAAGKALAAAANEALTTERIDLAAALDEGRLLPAIDHPDPAHLLLSGTGLTHLGSAEGRDRMHRAAASGTETDSMRMFRMGLEGGKPAGGPPGVQPEWFYKGDGDGIVGPGATLESPAFADDGSEEPEIAAIYVIAQDGTQKRLGFCLANEFSDHVTERGNYLWLAHSKLRRAALGAELVGELPADVRGTSRIRRGGAVLWEKPFLTGEANMSHTIANLEWHHFKYSMFRRPGDVHVHFFGTATLSFSDGVRTLEGDEFEIEAPPFMLPLRNPLGSVATPRTSATPL
jgi:hypothetical protein